MSFEYGGEDRKTDDVIRDSRTRGGVYDTYLEQDVQTFKSTEGENQIRILPGSWKDDDGRITRDWAYGVYLHNGIGPDESSFICMAKMKPGSECVICKARLETKDEDEQKALRVNWRPHAFLIDRKKKTGPIIWGMPVKQIFNEINARCIDRETGGIIKIDHPEKGYDIFFDRVGSKDRTEYKAVSIARDPTPLSKNDDLFWADEKNGKVVYGGEWLDYIAANPIPSILHYHEQEYIESVLFARPTEKSTRRSRDEGESEGARRSRDVDDDRPARRSRDDDDKPARREARSDDDSPRRSRNDGDRPASRERSDYSSGSSRRRLASDEDDRPSRRSREDDAPRGRDNGREGRDDDPPFKPRSRPEKGEDKEDPSEVARAAMDELKSQRRSRD